MTKKKPLVQKRRQRAVSLKNQKRKQKASVSRKPPVLSTDVTPEMFPDTQMFFWLAHGVNHILSDHEKGLWTPLFEGIYEGNLSSPNAIAEGLMAKYAGVTEWPIEAKAAIGWAVSNRKIVYIYYKEALRRLAACHPEEELETMAIQPHQPEVWSLFAYMKNKVLNRSRK